MPRKICKPVHNIEAAIRAYYGNGYIDNKSIKEIFECSESTVCKMKKMVRDEEIKQGVPIVIPRHVNARIAFDVWGIDVKQLEKNRQKLMDLKLA